MVPTIEELYDTINRLQSAWLRCIQIDNKCAVTGKPCHSHKCACALEMQAYVDAEKTS